MQMEAKKKSADFATKYSQMRETEELEEAFEVLKEKIEFMTINTMPDVSEAVEL